MNAVTWGAHETVDIDSWQFYMVTPTWRRRRRCRRRRRWLIRDSSTTVVATTCWNVSWSGRKLKMQRTNSGRVEPVDLTWALCCT